MNILFFHYCIYLPKLLQMAQSSNLIIYLMSFRKINQVCGLNKDSKEGLTDSNAEIRQYMMRV